MSPVAVLTPAVPEELASAAKAAEAGLIPIVLVLVFILFVPFIQAAYWSFTNYNGLDSNYEYVGFDNYVRAVTDPGLAAGLWFTVFYAVASTLLTTVLAIPLAVALNRRFFGRNAVRAIFFFPAIPSLVVLGAVWAFILSPLSTGALNSILNLISIEPVAWLASPSLAQASVVVVGVWTTTGWHAILYLAYLQSIPEDFYEAATLDGANGLQKFWYLTLPMLRPAIATTSTLLLMVWGMNVYALPIALTGGGPGFSTFTITQTIITQGIAQGRYGQAAAVSIIFMAIIAVLIALQLALGADKKVDKTKVKASS